MGHLTGREEGADRPPASAALHAVVEGRVQGVGFRAFVRARAQALGVAGWVCNRPDGSVELAAIGTPEAIAELRSALLTGPPRAAVEAIRELPLVSLRGRDRFEVVRPSAPPRDLRPQTLVEALVTASGAPSRLRDDVRAALRPVPDFPIPGVLFQDITPVLADAGLFGRVIAAMAEQWTNCGITYVAAVESRGFVLGGAVAVALGAGFVPVRKPGRLPRAAARVEYALEYRRDVLEMHRDACSGGQVLVLDDVLATGGTAAAACALVEEVGAKVVGAAFLLSIGVLGGSARLAGRRIAALVDC